MTNFKMRENFDENESLIVFHTKSKQAIYHTKLADRDVHIIVDSSVYAKELICSGTNPKLGEKIFEKVITLQDKNPKSVTYGLWPYYMEESLPEMDEPDKNMAGFNSREMIEVLYNAPDMVSDELKKKMIDSIYCACRAIIKRNEGVNYTNVAFMESLVLCCGAKLAANESFLRAGRKKLRKSLGFIDFNGSVFEHNSPCYTFLCVKDLGSILKYVKDDEALFYAERINEYIWKMLAENFEYDTLQLGGAQSRAYNDYMQKDGLEIIMTACGLEELYKKHPNAPKGLRRVTTNALCPERFVPYFSGEKVWKSSKRIIMRGFNYPFFAFGQAVTHYRGERFTLGTFNREELWNQRRPMLSYIKGKENVYCFRVKCCHDGYDFSSAVIHSVQKDNKVLGNINFSSNRGDTHIGLDPVKKAAIEAEDFRITFEIEGDIKNINYSTFENGVEIDVEGVPVKISDIYAEFSGYEVSCRAEKTDECFRYSIVIYSGERKKIDFGKMEEAIYAFAVEIGRISDISNMNAAVEGDYLKTEWNTDGDKLELHTLKSAHPFEENMYKDKQFINGEELFKYLDDMELQE